MQKKLLALRLQAIWRRLRCGFAALWQSWRDLVLRQQSRQVA